MESCVVLAQHVLLLVNVVEEPPEQDSGNKADNSGASKNPGEVRIVNESREGKSKCISDALGQKVQGRDKTTHVDWSSGVCNTVCRDIDKELRKSADTVWDRDPPDSDGGKKLKSVCINASNGATVFAAWTFLVCVVVENGITYATAGTQEQSSCDTRDGTISDAELAEHWIKDIVDEGSANDNEDRVKVL